jgi:hypothetical protein
LQELRPPQATMASMQSIPDGFVLVKAPADQSKKVTQAAPKDTKSAAEVPGVDAKSNSVLPDTPPKRVLIHLMSGNSKGGRMSPMKIRLALMGNSAGSAATPLTFAAGVQPSASSEWSSAIALFNEFRVTGCRVKWFTYNTIGTSVNPVFCGVVYDPQNSSALPSFTALYEYGQYHDYVCGTNVFPLAETGKGMYEFAPKLPRGPLSSNLSSSVVISKDEWTPTSASGSVCGYFKWYVPSFGTGVSAGVSWIMLVDVEFRYRQ